MTKKEIQDKNIATSNLDNKNPALEGNFSNKNIEESIKKPAEGGYEENKKNESVSEGLKTATIKKKKREEARMDTQIIGLDIGRGYVKGYSLYNDKEYSCLFKSVYGDGRNISLEDINQAKKLGYKIKLLAIAENKDRGIVARVHPVLIGENHPLAGVQYEFNAVYVDGDYLGQTMYYGRGAGGNPTGSAVVSDIIAIGKAILSQTKPELAYASMGNKDLIDIEDLDFAYYIRLVTGHDKLGQGGLVDLLDKKGLKIRSIDKTNRNLEISDIDKIPENTDLGQNLVNVDQFVIVTERVREKDFKKAIKDLEDISNSITVIRIEEDI